MVFDLALVHEGERSCYPEQLWPAADISVSSCRRTLQGELFSLQTPENSVHNAISATFFF